MKHREYIQAQTVKKREMQLLDLDQSTLKNSGLFLGNTFYIPTLTFLTGEALGKELPLVKQQLTLGRGEGADVVIVDPSVSRIHVQLTCRKVMSSGDECETVKVVLRDLGSKNGTLVNYKRVRRAVLKPGDKIIIGRIILKFEYRDLADQNFYEEIYRLATTDQLTSLLNKATITKTLATEILKRQRYRSQLSVMLLDIDHFKNFNDTYGHLIGDKALQSVARILARNLRKQDVAGRFGGEEFLVVSPETGPKGVTSLAHRIRTDLEKHAAKETEVDRSVTASIGVAAYPKGGSTVEELLENADRALYQAKEAGRNRVELWQSSKESVGDSRFH